MNITDLAVGSTITGRVDSRVRYEATQVARGTWDVRTFLDNEQTRKMTKPAAWVRSVFDRPADMRDVKIHQPA